MLLWLKIFTGYLYRRFHIRPRVLRCVATRDQSTVVLGTKVQVPFGIAPTAMHCMADPEGECASARGEKLRIGLNTFLINLML